MAACRFERARASGEGPLRADALRGGPKRPDRAALPRSGPAQERPGAERKGVGGWRLHLMDEILHLDETTWRAGFQLVQAFIHPQRWVCVCVCVYMFEGISLGILTHGGRREDLFLGLMKR